jgi:hypothetical protein
MTITDDPEPGRREQGERGVYRQPNGKFALCFMLNGEPRFRTVEGGFEDARSQRARPAIAAQAGLLPGVPAADVRDGGRQLA